MNLYCDTGSRFTIIPPDLYKADMREVIPARCHLRAWGAETHLDTKGMLCTTLVTSARAKKLTWVYVVGGTDPEPLLGDTDAEDLGIISTWRETSHSRRASEHCESSSGDIMLTEDPWQQHSCQSMVSRNHSLLGKTHLTTSGRYYLWRMHGHCTGIHRPSLHWTNWTYEDTAITHQYDMGFQPPHIPVPYHYRDCLAIHLQKFKSEDIMEDVAPSEPIDCVLTIVISQRKTAGDIRMSIDARPLNLGAKHTKYHVTTPHEVRHLLEGAMVFLEMDMGAIKFP